MILMIIKRRSPTMRLVSKTHKVAFDWLFDQINLDPKSNTSEQKTNSKTFFTKGNFTRDEKNFLCLFNIRQFSFTKCSEVMSKKSKNSGVKTKQMMNLVSRCSERALDVSPSTASGCPGKIRRKSPLLVRSLNEQHQRTWNFVNKDAYSSNYSKCKFPLKFHRLDNFRSWVRISHYLYGMVTDLNNN